MKKLVRASTLLLAVAAGAVVLSCASKPAPVQQPEVAAVAEPVASPESEKAPAAEVKNETSVHTFLINGKIYTAYIFKDITQVLLEKEGLRKPLDVLPVAYDKKTTELTCKFEESAKNLSDAFFTVIGTVADKPQYILHNNTGKIAPLVAKDGKLLNVGSEYTFDKASNQLTITVPLNVEVDSYILMWDCGEYGSLSIANLLEAHQKDYDALIAQWEKSLEEVSQ